MTLEFTDCVFKGDKCNVASGYQRLNTLPSRGRGRMDGAQVDWRLLLFTWWSGVGASRGASCGGRTTFAGLRDRCGVPSSLLRLPHSCKFLISLSSLQLSTGLLQYSSCLSNPVDSKDVTKQGSILTSIKVYRVLRSMYNGSHRSCLCVSHTEGTLI